VKGCQQREGIDFSKIFSPIVKLTTIRFVLSIVVVEDLHLEQLDVKIAFLHGVLEEEIYATWLYHTRKRAIGLEFKKSLYDLKHALRQWYLKFDRFMISSEFTRLHAGHCYYFKWFENSYIILLLHVDNMLIVRSSMKEIVNLKAKLEKEFSMKNLSLAKKILGMKISREKKGC